MSHGKGLSLEPEQRLSWLRVGIAAAFLCGLGLSWRLWISSRLFPLSPIAGFLPAVRFPLDLIWFGALLGLLSAMMVVRSRWLIPVFLVLGGLLTLWDQERWQPWFLVYYFMLAAIGFYAWTRTDSRKHTALNMCRVVIVFTYIWSGLQKLNANFVREAWPDMAGPLFRFAPEVLKRLPPVLALVIPLMEIAIGLGLATRIFRNASVVFAAVTHMVILALLIGSGENTVVWPWNIAMAFLVVILFWQDRDTGPSAIFVSRNAGHALILLLFAVMPALSFFDFWDSYLSSALYSGNTNQAVIYLSAEVLEHMPAAIRPHVRLSKEPYFLDMNRWSYAELNVPLYPEPRIYRSITRQVCRWGGSSAPGQIMLRILEKPDLFTAERKSEFYDCEHVF
ncbi:MAG TPA: hypothetical protein VKH81_23330 [Candidatus Angelobacter sp.]|nr:hypothetical protein [Candidatus Angelobacter sp.]